MPKTGNTWRIEAQRLEIVMGDRRVSWYRMARFWVWHAHKPCYGTIWTLQHASLVSDNGIPLGSDRQFKLISDGSNKFALPACTAWVINRLGG
jgi:hypothetical protein